ncbi:MAG: DegT/DnrJ/EryC1/StrS family aminotransferase [Anaerolineae bacterium]|nr:DegT/DnrJ/EryC1/StrS family aminotransferase [Anaerolineae bacterium]
MITLVKPILGPEEQAAVAAVLASGQLAQGARVAEFEERFAAFCGVRHAVAVTSGTMALWLALLAHDIGPGDEVITTPFSFIATANVALYTGATPVFVDIDPRTFNLDPDRIEEAITPRTRAILPVHLYGLPCDMDRIMATAARHGLAVIEDACQAHGAAVNGRHVGSFGAGCFSFYATKNMTTGEGGIMTTNDEAIADRARVLRAHGMRQRYYHEQLGHNFRMTDIQAAIGLVQLDRLPELTARRQANAAFLASALADMETLLLPVCDAGYEHVYHQFTIRLPDHRDAFRSGMAARDVATEIYYPRLIPEQAVYRDMGFDCYLPNAEAAVREVVSLPVHPALSPADLEQIAWAVTDTLAVEASAPPASVSVPQSSAPHRAPDSRIAAVALASSNGASARLDGDRVALPGS